MSAINMAAEFASEEYSDDENPEVQGPWKPESLADVDWCLSRLAKIEAEIAENNKLREAAIVRIELRHKKLNEQAARGQAFFTAKVREYATIHRAELLQGKKKSRNLINGSIGWRKVGGGLEVVDREALIGWVREQPIETGVLRIKEEPDLPAIKQFHKATGEIPRGMDVKPESEEFVLKATRDLTND